jgi:hypothetical protein
VAAKNIVVIRSRNAYNAADEFWQGAPVAVITDARDLGVQLYANDAGSMYFTLPVDHPALPLIDPINQHYVVQRWNGSSYDTIQSGFITDYDASSNEVVITGVDYMTTLNKYYTPIHGPELGAKAIPNTDTTILVDNTAPTADVTPKTVIDGAITKDRLKASESYAVATVNSSYPDAGKVSVFSGAAQNAAIPSGSRDSITVTYEEISGVKTGTVILSGCVYIYRANYGAGSPIKYDTFQDGETGEIIEGNLSIGTSSSSKGKIGFIVSSNPGGPLAKVEYDVYVGTGGLDIGMSNNVPLNFSVKLRPVSNFASASEVHNSTSSTNLNRTMSILSEGVSYEFYVTPYYYGNLSPASATPPGGTPGTGNVDYNQYIWGATTRAPESAFTAGLQTNTVRDAFDDLFDVNDPANVLERTSDYPAITPAPEPLIKFMSIEHLGTSTTTKHPYVTAGQGPVDFMRDLADIEMGSRENGKKVVFNFYGVPSASPDGKKLSVHHSVSPDPQATLIYPGQIMDFNVTNKRSLKVTSARVIPTTDFLIGASTEGAGGAKTKGVVKVATGTTSASPALPSVISQGGFLSADAAGNHAQGIINDFGQDSDVQTIRVSLRTEQFGPIGVSGTPKLGETVKVVVRRKGVTVGGDELSGNYNVGGMQWIAKIDGTERLSLDLVKPSKFKGPAITWEQKPAPTPEPAAKPYAGRKPAARRDPAGNELPDPKSTEGMTGAFTGTSYMYPSTSGAPMPPAAPKINTYSGGNRVGLPRNVTGKRKNL